MKRGTSCLIFFLLIFSMLISPIIAQTQKERVAVITYMKGNVYIRKANSEVWIVAKTNMGLSSGDKIWVQQNSQATLVFSDKSTLKLAANTQLDILKLDYDKETQKEVSIFKLLLGKVWATVEKLLSQGEKIEVQTPTAIAGVRGTEWIQEVSEDGTTRVRTLKGIVSLSAQEIAVDVPEGMQSIVKPGNPPEAPSPAPSEEKFEEEFNPEEMVPSKEEKESKETETAAPQETVHPQEKIKETNLSFKNEAEYGLYKKDDLMLAKISFCPELSFGAIKLGLDLSLYTNGEDLSYIEGRVKYGELNLPWLGVRYGIIDDFDLGYWLVANRYSTNQMNGFILRLEDPEIGGILTLIPSPFNREENINTTYALRLFYKPLRKLEIGLNTMADLDADPNKKQIILGVDAGYSLTKNVITYLSFAQRIMHDGIGLEDSRVASENGVVLGAQINVPILNTVIELQGRSFSDNFTPGYFDAYYERDKSRDKLPPLAETTGRINGVLFGISTNILGIAELNITYESYQNIAPSLYGNLALSLGERINATLEYQQVNISSPFMLINPNSKLSLNVDYPIAQNVDAILTIIRTFDTNGTPTDIYLLSTKIYL
ncbi:MAG TPA: FecR family protein [Dictyoglomaceae bacterium]|nr:FecR family protein [Dictyoglomaceae bacterium]